MNNFTRRFIKIWRSRELVRASVYTMTGVLIAWSVESVLRVNRFEDIFRSFPLASKASTGVDHVDNFTGVLVTPPLPAKPNPTNQMSPLAYAAMQSVGLPEGDRLSAYKGFVVSYDRRGRIPRWVMEHLTTETIGKGMPGKNPSYLEQNVPMNVDTRVPTDRSQFDFFEDLDEHAMFRSQNTDYKNSGFDRGHMVPAGDFRFDAFALKQTFILSNIAPQVGAFFNRDAWSDLEKYVRAIARRNANTIVVTGPLFLPKLAADGSNAKEVSYRLIGSNDVAVPTHFFKALATQATPGAAYTLFAWIMPNTQLPKGVRLADYQFPLATVERAAGLRLFSNIPRK